MNKIQDYYQKNGLAVMVFITLISIALVVYTITFFSSQTDKTVAKFIMRDQESDEILVQTLYDMQIKAIEGRAEIISTLEDIKTSCESE